MQPATPRDPKPTGGATTSVLVARHDGAWMVADTVTGIAPRPPRGGLCTTPDGRWVGLAHVRVGGRAGMSQLHATIAEGRHAGLELRAIERDGRVVIELRAPLPGNERALRAELPRVRDALAARGLQDVTIDVGVGREGSGGRPWAQTEGTGEPTRAGAERSTEAYPDDPADGVVL
jgi:hypothetical protein